MVVLLRSSLFLLLYYVHVWTTGHICPDGRIIRIGVHGRFAFATRVRMYREYTYSLAAKGGGCDRPHYVRPPVFTRPQYTSDVRMEDTASTSVSAFVPSPLLFVSRHVSYPESVPTHHPRELLTVSKLRWSDNKPPSYEENMEWSTIPSCSCHRHNIPKHSRNQDFIKQNKSKSSNVSSLIE